MRDNSTQRQDLPQLLSSALPECEPAFWPTLRRLLVEGAPQEALQLLQKHSLLNDSDAVHCGLTDDLLTRLQALLENLPRLTDPSLLQSHLEGQDPQLEMKEALKTFKLQWNAWANDVAHLRRDADALAADVAAPEIAWEISLAVRILAGDEEQIKRDSHGSWHGELLAKLLYKRPTQYRWEASRPLPPGRPLLTPSRPLLTPLQHRLLYAFVSCPIVLKSESSINRC